ncbi:MAG: DedA family protein [Tepidisphaeraceae bacterium]|jgi:membrane protein DedA with SNARE-associated domain
MNLFTPQILGLLDFQHVRPWLESGGYTVLFLLLFSCGLGMPLPEDIPLITAGVLISQRHMHLGIVAPVAWLGIMGGDTVLYCIGYRFGRNISRLPIIGKHVTPHRIDRAEVLFARWGILMVAVGRLFAGVRGTMVLVAGTTRFNYVKFIIADGLAAVVSGGMFICMGMWFGNNLGVMWHKAHEFKLILMVAALILLIAIWAYVRWRAVKHKTLADVLVDEVPPREVSEPQDAP